MSKDPVLDIDPSEKIQMNVDGVKQCKVRARVQIGENYKINNTK